MKVFLKVRILSFMATFVGLISGCSFQPPSAPYRPQGTLYLPESSAIQEHEGATTPTPSRSYFCPGDTEAVVEMVQGTPSSISGTGRYPIWFYGADTVEFREGRVYKFTNFGSRLKVRMFPTAPSEGAGSETSPPANNVANPVTSVGDGHYTDGTEGGNYQELAPQAVSLPSTTRRISPEVDLVPSADPPTSPAVYTPSVSLSPTTSTYGEISRTTGLPKTIPVSGYFRKDGTYVRPHYRSRR